MRIILVLFITFAWNGRNLYLPPKVALHEDISAACREKPLGVWKLEIKKMSCAGQSGGEREMCDDLDALEGYDIKLSSGSCVPNYQFSFGEK